MAPRARSVKIRLPGTTYEIATARYAHVEQRPQEAWNCATGRLIQPAKAGAVSAVAVRRGAGELAQLRAAFQSATDRSSALVMLVGEPGIDNTALCEHVEEHVRSGRRERGGAALLARSMTNRHIADALVITESTSEVHSKHILGKLGLKSRARSGSGRLSAKRDVLTGN